MSEEVRVIRSELGLFRKLNPMSALTLDWLPHHDPELIT